MSPSPHYARIRAQVHDIVERIPVGRLTTYAAIGDELAVPARHVASILARTDAVPWQRVVAEDGALAARRRDEHRARLEAEGVAVSGGRVRGLDQRLVAVVLDETHRAHADTPLGRAPEDLLPG